ncbi:MAG: TolC family protein, partial [Candidatus Acidiferrum sp.]
LLGVLEEGLSRAGSCAALLPRVACQLRAAEFKLRETQLALDDLRGKLALGVTESRAAILSGREQVREGAAQIRNSAETYRLSDLRLKENVPNASVTDVSQSIRGLELAHLLHVSAVTAHNKAQLRLQLLLGGIQH